jgi:hypothetical protein
MRILLDYLEAGDSLEVFLDHVPSISAISDFVGWVESAKPNKNLLRTN